jgi:L-ascorbate metabolism protein UlaG (beta-lactamase superfamily)
MRRWRDDAIEKTLKTNSAPAAGRRHFRIGVSFLQGRTDRSDWLKVTLIANAGILVEAGGVTVLVDGIHNEGGHPFSKVSPEDIQLMCKGTDIFANLDYLLFTHEHPDHFTPQIVQQYIQCRPVKGFFLPGEHNGSPELKLLLEELRKRAIPHWSLGLRPAETQQVVLDDGLIVTVIGTRHMGPQYQAVRNDCFLLTLAGRNLLFTGDADPVPDYFAKAMEETAVDVVFVNPLFFNNAKGQEIINELFRPSDVVIYHLPFAQDDTMSFSAQVERDIKRFKHPARKYHMLNRKRQSLLFPSSPLS